MPSITPIGKFPSPIQSKMVAAGSTVEVYRFDVPLGHVGFLYYVGTGVMPEGASATWLVDGKVVEVPELGVVSPIIGQVGSVDEPLLINPPIVVESSVVWSVFSPVDAEFAVLLDGEVYKAPWAGVFGRMVAEALEAIELPAPVKRSNYIDEWKNVAVDGMWEACNLKGEGEVREFWVLATTTGFEVVVEVDGRIEHEGSYSDFVDKSVYTDAIVALKSDDNYRVHLSDIPFSESLRIYVRGSLTLSKAYLDIHLEVA